MRGLLAIEEMYRQIVKGDKTQTRRSGGLDAVNIAPDEWEIVGHERIEYACPDNYSGLTEATFQTINYIPFGELSTKLNKICKPRYKPGEVLYIKEPWLKLKKDTTDNDYGYKYGSIFEGGMSTKIGHVVYESGKPIKFVSKLFMPARAARAFIKITNIKCERLLDISDEDCLAEGIEKDTEVWDRGIGHPYKLYDKKIIDCTGSAKESFISLYKYANKMKPSDRIENLWVWVYEFIYLPGYKL